MFDRNKNIERCADALGRIAGVLEAFKGDWDTLTDLPPLTEIAEIIHYPECWDVMVYPKITDAIHEIYAGCHVCKKDPELDPDNLMKESGRGIFLIKQLTDSLDFNFTDNGTEIIISKNIQ